MDVIEKCRAVNESQNINKALDLAAAITPDGALDLLHVPLTLDDLDALNFTLKHALKPLKSVTLRKVNADDVFITELLRSAIFTQNRMSLKYVNLSTNEIGAAGAMTLAKALGPLKVTLGGGEVEVGTGSGVDSLGLSVDMLKSLRQHEEPPGRETPVSSIPGSETPNSELEKQTPQDDTQSVLTSQTQPSTVLTDSGFMVESLKLANNQIGDDGVTAIGVMLAVNQRLQELDVSCNDIGETGVKALASGLAKNKTLKSLKLSYDHFDGSGAEALGKVLALTSCRLTDLDISYSGLGDLGAKLLSQGLNNNTCLQSLLLVSNEIADEGAIALSEMLSQHKMGLKSLKITSNQGTESSQAAAISENLLNRGVNGLKSLRLSGNVISDHGAQALAKALSSNQSLTTLDLASNQISNQGASSISEMLKVNKTLNDLNLSANAISGIGARAIGNSLVDQFTLLELDLSENPFSDSGAMAIGEALKSDSALEMLNISDCGIGDLGAAVIADGIVHNKNLTDLYLMDNSMGPDVLTALMHATQINTNVDLEL